MGPALKTWFHHCWSQLNNQVKGLLKIGIMGVVKPMLSIIRLLQTHTSLEIWPQIEATFPNPTVPVIDTQYQRVR